MLAKGCVEVGVSGTAAAADWKEARSVVMEDGDIEDCLLGAGHGGSEDDNAEAGSLNSQRWPRSFRCVRARFTLSRSLLDLVSSVSCSTSRTRAKVLVLRK